MSPPSARRQPSRRIESGPGFHSSIHSSLEEASVPAQATSLMRTEPAGKDSARGSMTVGVGEREGVGEKEGVRVAVEMGVSVGETVGEALASSVGKGSSSVSVSVGGGVSVVVESGDGRDIVVVDSVAAADSVA